MLARCGAELNHRFHRPAGSVPDMNAMFSPALHPEAASRSALGECTSGDAELPGTYAWARCNAQEQANACAPELTPRAPSPADARRVLRMLRPLFEQAENAGAVGEAGGATGPGSTLVGGGRVAAAEGPENQPCRSTMRC